MTGLLDGDRAEPARPLLDGDASPLPSSKLIAAIATLAALIGATYLVPDLGQFAPWTTDDPVPFWNVLGRYREPAPVQALATDLVRDAVGSDEDETPLVDRIAVADPARGGAPPAFSPRPGDDEPAPQPIEDPSGHALDRFFAALARTDAALAGAVTHVAHFGDSAIGVDGITSAVRRRMQRRFGDAGHGFHLLQPPNASYRHQGVEFSTNGRWNACFVIEKCKRDGHYGLGGVTYQSVAGAESTFATARDGAHGRSVSRFEIYYAAQPGGGRLQVRIDDRPPEAIDTAAEALVDRFATFTVPDGPHTLELRAAGGGKVRAYGVALERDGPGVVWDELSLIGAFTNRLAELDRDHLQRQLAHRETDLVVLMFGGNDMIRTISMSEYQAEYARVLDHVLAAEVPPACLIMAPLDHGERAGARIVSRAIVAEMVRAQRELALRRGCAFFDTHAAMGGEGSAGRWFRASPRLMSGDLAHLTHAGHRVVGELLHRALMAAYVSYRRAEPPRG